MQVEYTCMRERERAHPIDQAMHGSLEFWSYS